MGISWRHNEGTGCSHRGAMHTFSDQNKTRKTDHFHSDSVAVSHKIIDKPINQNQDTYPSLYFTNYIPISSSSIPDILDTTNNAATEANT